MFTKSSMATVTAVLNVYKRVDYLEKQIDSLLAQTHKIHEFIVRVNAADKKYRKIVESKIPKAIIMECSDNIWVWARFFAAFNAKSEYIFVVDDDIIPWRKYIERCVDQQNTHPGVYGSRWSVFRSMTVRWDRQIYCESQTEDNRSIRPHMLTEVDMSGHSRFFPKKYLGIMFDEMPDKQRPTCWEELWVSYRPRIYWIKTYVPAMTDDIETRWNKEPKLGLDRVANYNTEKDKYQEFYEYAIHHWFTPMRFEL